MTDPAALRALRLGAARAFAEILRARDPDGERVYTPVVPDDDEEETEATDDTEEEAEAG